MSLGIRGKLFLSIVTVFLAMVLLSVIIFNQSMQSSLLEKFQQNEQPTISKLQDAINNLLLQNQEEQIPLVIFEEKKYHPNMEYVLFQDLQGKVLAHSFLRPIPAGLLQAHSLASGMDYSVKYLQSETFKVFDVAVPIQAGGQIGGVLRVGFDMEFVERTIARQTILLLAITGIGALIVTILLSLLLKYFLAPLKLLQEKIEEIAQGEADLTRTLAIHSRDEIGRVSSAFNKFIGQLAEMVKRIAEASQVLVQASQDLSRTSETTAYAAEQIADSSQKALADTEKQLEDVAAIRRLVQSLAEGVQEANANAQKVEKVVEETVQYATDGEQAQQQALQQMQSVEESVRQATMVIRNLEVKSGEIGQILEIISNFADQTNLLALNAAIEAARAGEQGRGFAVVADEVRKLAEGSAQAVMRIDKMLQEIRQGTEEAVASMEQGTAVTAAGLKQVEKTARLFGQIKEAIERIADETNLSMEQIKQVVADSNRLVDLSEAIDEAAKENAGAMQEVAAAVEEQTNAMEQVSQATGRVEAMARDLDEVVRRFKVN